MPRYAYDRLTALDNSFLVLERPTAYTHVASTQIFDAGPLRTEGGGIDFEAIRKAHAAVLHRIPRYRQVLKWTPLEGTPVWVDDPTFHLDFHLRHTALPHPGSDDQLKRLSARVMQQHLDRRRPLWETWVVEGLEGNRFALISKVHHCMIDGVSGVDLLQILLSPDPEAELPTPPDYVPRPAPSGAELLRDALWQRLSLPFDALRDFRSFVGEARDVRREIAFRARAAAETLGQTLRAASETPINQTIGPHRRFDWLAMDISDIKDVRKRLGGSLNDVVLTVVTGAFRRFFQDRGVDVTGLDFRVLAPVSVRSESERGALGNRVSAWIIQLPLDEADPKRQLERIARRTAELKTLLSLGARNATRLLPFNTIVTNVPGPQVPIFLLGARMLEAYPHVPLVDHVGLGIALLSSAGRIHWGINADYDLMPDLGSFVSAIGDAFEAMRRIDDPAAEPTPRRKAAARRKPRRPADG
jgi:WS/DGAT/MGAT family acyltransferase